MPSPLAIDNRKDFLLLILAAADAAPVVGVTRMQKYAFLLQERYGWHQRHHIKKPYEFRAYDYGPFDAQIYDDLEFLENLGLVRGQSVGAVASAEVGESRARADDWGTGDPEFAPWNEQDRVFRYELTTKGREFAARYRLDPDERKELDELKRTWNDRPLQQLLRWLYKEFESFAANTRLEHLRHER